MAAHPECAASHRPRFEIGDIVRRHRDEFEDAFCLSVDQQRALSAIAMCRTDKLGGHLDVCTTCGDERPSYNSCRNRHCPKCQSLAQEKWVADRLARVLPTSHFHVVFTLPAPLRALARYRAKVVYALLFEAASATLIEVGRGPRLGATLGVTAVLHTWTRELEHHPHLHCIVTAGGIATTDQTWLDRGEKYLLPVRVLSTVFRGKFLSALRREHRRNSFEGFHLFEDPLGFERFCSSITKKRWHVYAKKPFAKAEHVFHYLGRYTHRVGISNSRLLEVDDQHVRFATKVGRDISLSPLEFLSRFALHILPKSFVKIRHYGLYAATNAKTLLEYARDLLSTKDTTGIRSTRAASWIDLLLALTGRDVRRCVLCSGVVEATALPIRAPTPVARAPPT